jgi:hypothetical protein
MFSEQFRNCAGVWYALAVNDNVTIMTLARDFCAHQNTISQCGGRPGSFSTAEYSLIASMGIPLSSDVVIHSFLPHV